MGRLFSMDNKFFVFMGRVADLILLNLYFVVSCIPIVTIGPALTALHYVTMKMVKNEESYIFREYVKSFKQNFRQGLIINLIMMFTAVLLFLDIRLVNQMSGNLSRVLYCIFLAIGILYFMIWLYVYPVLAKFYNTIRNTFTNAFLMAIRHLPYTIMMGAICIAPIALLFFPNAQILNFLTLVFILCGFSLIAFCNSFLLVKIFEKYIPKQEEEPNSDYAAPEMDGIETFSESAISKSGENGAAIADTMNPKPQDTDGSHSELSEAESSHPALQDAEDGSSSELPKAESGHPAPQDAEDGSSELSETENGHPAPQDAEDSSSELPKAESSHPAPQDAEDGSSELPEAKDSGSEPQGTDQPGRTS